MRLYSLDELREARATAAAAANHVENEAKAAKKQVKVGAAELQEAERIAVEQQAAAHAAAEIADEEEESARRAEHAVAAAERDELSRQHYDSWQTTYSALLSEIEGLLGEVKPGADLELLLQSADVGAQAQYIRDTERRAALNERIASADASLERLHTASGECPVCRRPLDEASR